MELKDIKDLFILDLQDLYSAEKQILEALPTVIEKCSDENLKQAVQNHLDQTKEQKQRLENIAKMMNISLEGAPCKGMQGVLSEGTEMLKLKGDPELVDLAITEAAKRVEAYEKAAYSAALAHGYMVQEENEDILTLLEATLSEEAEMYQILSSFEADEDDEEADIAIVVDDDI